MKKKSFLIGIVVFSFSFAFSQEFNIIDYGAKGDGLTLDTKAIQEAIDACTNAGGGRVILPAGKTYLTGTIYLKEYVTFVVENGAVLKGSSDIEDYATDTYKTRYKMEKHMNRCLIYAEDAKNIAIEGYGTIDGNGHRKYFNGETGRPMLMRFLNCDDMHVSNVTIINPASWTTDWVYCDNITVTGVKVNAQVNHNGAALCFDGCINVGVTNCAFDTSDDAVAITASHKDKPCKNITVSNCTFTGIWAAMRIGLLSLGDFESITVTNCTFTNISDSGFKIQMNEGAEMKNMVFSNIVMKNVPRPIFMTFCQQKASVDAPDEMFPMKAMHHFSFNNIIIDNGELDKNSAIFITGMPDNYITDIQLSDIQMVMPGGGTKADANKTDLNEYTLEVLDGWWPEFSLVGTLPASGIYMRHVKDLYMSNVHLKTISNDERPAIFFQDVKGSYTTRIYSNGRELPEGEIPNID